MSNYVDEDSLDFCVCSHVFGVMSCDLLSGDKDYLFAHEMFNMQFFRCHLGGITLCL